GGRGRGRPRPPPPPRDARPSGSWWTRDRGRARRSARRARSGPRARGRRSRTSPAPTRLAPPSTRSRPRTRAGSPAAPPHGPPGSSGRPPRGRPRAAGPRSRRPPQHAEGVVLVHLREDGVGKAEAVDPPAPLGRDGGRRVVEVLVLGLEEPVVDLVELVLEDLLRVALAVGGRHGIGPEEDPVLVLLGELPRGARLAAQLSDARSDLDRHVGQLVEGGGHEGQVL